MGGQCWFVTRFVDFVPTMPMEEIWRLCENEQQANAMASHYNNVWAPEQSAKYKINPNYINELVVITGGSSTIPHVWLY
ncbi:hypothetical protein KS43_04605 [Pectobacterium odoriferum]|nr:hypothetical protein KS43_04605 [Pectobacterium odoriferum]